MFVFVGELRQCLYLLVDSYLAQGLLHMVVGALVAEPLESPFLYFLAGIIESFLRGAEAADRLMLCQAAGHRTGHSASTPGLLAHVTGRLTAGLASGAGSASGACQSLDPASVQCLFDLLAELLRFCPKALQSLEVQLGPAGVEQLLALASSQLVCCHLTSMTLLSSPLFFFPVFILPSGWLYYSTLTTLRLPPMCLCGCSI